MAKRTNRRATAHADFAGPDAAKEAIEKLAKSASEANAKAGHNSGEVPDETLQLHVSLIKAAKLELAELLKDVAAKRGVLGNRKKVAKKDGCDVEAIMLGLKLEERVATGGSSPIVSEHRQVGRVLKILDCPLYTQFKLFDLDAEQHTETKSEEDLIKEATLAGEHAGLNGEPKENNPHRNAPGSPKWFGWNNGWQVGADKLTDSFKTGRAPAPAGEAATH